MLRFRGVIRQTLVALGLALSVGLALYVADLWGPTARLLSGIEGKLVDLRFRLRGVRTPSGEVVIVAIDSRSTAQLGRWPWPRTTHAALVDQLREWGASTVAFDVMFIEPEGRDAAERLRQIEATLPADAAASRAAIASALDATLTDQALGDAFGRALDSDYAWPVLAYHFVYPEDVLLRGRLDRVLDDAEEQIILDIASYPSRDENSVIMRTQPPKLALAIRPALTSLMEMSASVGFVNEEPDADGALRRERMLVAYGSNLRQAYQRDGDLGVALRDPKSRVQAFMPLAVSSVLTHLRVGIADIQLDLASGSLSFRGASGEHRVTFDRVDATAYINYFGPARTIPTYSFTDVLDGHLLDASRQPLDGRDAFAGKLVFVGMSDPGLTDYFTTPFSQRLPGVEKHATAAENLLFDQLIRTHADADLMRDLSVLLTALTVAVVAANLSAMRTLGLLTVIAVAVLSYSQYQFSHARILWNWTMPLLTLFGGTGIVTAYRQLTEERDKRRIRAAFSTYMSPAAVDEVLSAPDKLKLGGERRECSIFFSDLVGFTSLSEALGDPKALVELMNRYLGRMTEKILDEDGILDKYIGDAIMAIFGAPITRPDHAARACRAALANFAALDVLRTEFKAEGLPDIDCRIGINTGVVVVGNMGSELRMDYTCLGDPVNLASRLEGANKAYGSHIMVGETTWAQAVEHDADLAFRPLDLIAVKGKNEPVKVFELIGKFSELDPRRRTAREHYLEGFAIYEAEGRASERKDCERLPRRFAEARDWFEKALEVDPDDGPAKTYAERCRVFVDDPPDDDWDGVFRMKTK